MDASAINPDRVRVGDALLVRVDVIESPKDNGKGAYSVLVGAETRSQLGVAVHVDWSIVAQHQRRFAVGERITWPRVPYVPKIGEVVLVHDQFAVVVPEGSTCPEVWPMADCELALPGLGASGGQD